MVAVSRDIKEGHRKAALIPYKKKEKRVRWRS